MNTDKDQNKAQQVSRNVNEQHDHQDSEIFKHTPSDKKSRDNSEQEAELEQERKEAMTERD